MATTPCIRTGFVPGPTTTRANIGEELLIPNYINGGKPIHRLISVAVFTITTGAWTYAGANVLKNGVRNHAYGDLVSGQVMLDDATLNRLIFKDAITSAQLVWIQVQTDGKIVKAVYNPT